MSSYDRRAAARRRAWGRGPMILRFEPLEGRQLLTTATVKPVADLVATQFTTVHSSSWGSQIAAIGSISNRGNATTSVASEVDIYASTSPALNAPGAVTQLLGVVTIPAGLKPKQSDVFNQLITLPQEGPNTSATSSTTLYITLQVDPNNVLHETNLADKAGRGLGLDTSPLIVTQQMPADLRGTAFSVAPISTAVPGVYAWGDTFSVTEQVKNAGVGNAPPTRARIVLTPIGSNPGTSNDVTIGSIPVPAIPAFQSTNVIQKVTLPAIEPATLQGASQFTISVVQDADFLTQPVYPRIADQGPGADRGPIGINPGPLAGAPQGPTPDLAPSSVVVSQGTLSWGQQFQVAAAIQNVSNVDAGPFTVRFVATGASGDITHGIFLGDAQVSGLAANATANVLTTVHLPAKLPYGDSIANPAYAQIYAIADPENVVNETLRTNNMAASAPVLLQVVGVDGATTVPTYPQNVYTSPTLVLQAAKKAAQAVKAASPKLGVATPASSTPKKHKVDLLASVSESIVKQIVAIPKGVTSLIKDIGASGGSNNANTTKAPNTNTATSNNSATSTLAAASSGFSGGTSGGPGGFGATGV